MHFDNKKKYHLKLTHIKALKQNISKLELKYFRKTKITYS